MCNAFLAIADDKEALWYNPAGLVQIKGNHFDIYDLMIGADSVGTLGTMAGGLMGGGVSSSSDRQFGRFGFFPAYYRDGFGMSLFYHLQSVTDFGNLARPEVDIYGASDLGLVTSLALPLSEHFAIGGSVHVVQRNGIDLTQDTTQFLTDLGVTADEFSASPYTYVKTLVGSGRGIGYHLGTLLKVPTGKRSLVSWALTVDDVLNTKFSHSAGAQLPTIPMSMNLGVALRTILSDEAHWTLAMDIRNFTSGLFYGKFIHLGSEWAYGDSSFRLGICQGYWTAGVGWETTNFRLSLSSYGAELGNGWLQRSQRWYLLEMSVGVHGVTRRSHGTHFE